MNKFLACGLLVPTNSPCNTPILSVKKKDRTWRMVQDLWIINEAVVPLHPTVPNPCVILGEILPSAKWFTVLGLTQAWKPSSHHAGEKRGVAGLLLGRTERAARAAELQLCAQAR